MAADQWLETLWAWPYFFLKGRWVYRSSKLGCRKSPAVNLELSNSSRFRQEDVGPEVAEAVQKSISERSLLNETSQPCFCTGATKVGPGQKHLEGEGRH